MEDVEYSTGSIEEDERMIVDEGTKNESNQELSELEVERVATLLGTLAEKPWLYDSHVEYITLLRRGFLHYRDIGKSSQYPFWNDLREARKSMASLFRLSEDMYAEWIADEIVADAPWEVVRQVFETALDLEPEHWTGQGARCSVRLWKMYGLWMEAETTKAKDNKNASAEQKNQFNDNNMMVAWEEAIEQTKGSIPNSHDIWNHYRDLLMKAYSEQTDSQKRDAVRQLVFDAYQERLSVIHATIQDTFSEFSTFITENYGPEEYEQIMVASNKRFSQTVQLLNEREDFERRIGNAKANGEIAEEWMAFSEYIEFEKASIQPKKWQRRHKVSDSDKQAFVERVSALFDRMVLTWHTESRVWEEYVFFMLENSGNATRNIATLGRASFSCPWNGTLWSMFLNSLDQAYKPLGEISLVNDKATENGILKNVGGLDEYFKVLYTWLNYQKRRALSPLREADDIELSSLEFEQAIQEYAGKDDTYRLERIYVDFLSNIERADEARQIWKTLSQKHGHSSEFWLRWFTWESEFGEKEDIVTLFNLAFKRLGKDLDWPEKILTIWKEWVEDACQPEEIEAMILRSRKLLVTVQERRTREAEISASTAGDNKATQAGAPSQLETELVSDHELSTSKRKRSETEMVSQETKRLKSEPVEALPEPSDGGATGGSVEIKPLSEASALKRDRENATVIVRNLPLDTPVVKIRQFFRNCGTINSLKVLNEPDEKSCTATIEFEDHEMALAAQTRDRKKFGESEISVQLGTGSTLYVTNFPPGADEAYIRGLFTKFGTIVDIRFPSLKYNSHRRFCYVQFTSPEEAQKATSLDGTQVGEKEALVVKISAPNQKKDREGAIYDGREVFIRNIDFRATEDDVRKAFEKFGVIERIKLPPGTKKGTHKGFGFVTFSKKEEADASLALNKVALKARILDVTIASANPGRFVHHNVIVRDTGAADTEMGDGDSEAPEERSVSADEIRKKTFAIYPIPDTVNDARLRALLEPYGSLRKLTLRPDHAGAIVEYESVADAGKASLALSGHEFEGNRLTVGTVPELKQQAPFVRNDKGFESMSKKGKEKEQKAADTPQASKLFAPSSLIRRAGRGPTTTRRPVIGLAKPALTSKPPSSEKDVDMGGTEPSDGNEAKGKSNNDFRKLLLGGK